jgi:hypothetical protein
MSYGFDLYTVAIFLADYIIKHAILVNPQFPI